ncbi:copper chaperone CopZ [bacterium LRH843]|nr:copper chaperone CopZ [bacterium LRH843]
MKNITLNVQGMSCGHCVKSIEGSVGQVAGVEQVKVNLADSKVEVAFDESKASPDQIKKTIEDQGYEVE